MYEATGGINTHKGAIYTMGILCGSLGRLWSAETPIGEMTSVLAECAEMVHSSVEADFIAADDSTAGLRTYLQYGLGGIRAEVASGLPSISHIALPCYQKALAEGLSSNDAGTVALLHLIAQVEDTNLYHRGGKEGAHWASEAAYALIKYHPYPSPAQIEALDDAFISRNLSPGGCADLLAVTYFLHALQ
jgi:holo-ACP synthase/triphosphoribosyl-dephospho-CoA synthase